MGKGQLACRDCKMCTNSGFANAGRSMGRKLAAVSTVGMSELAMATQKKCRQCGHQMSLHGVDQVGAAVQPTVQVQPQPTVATQPTYAPPPPPPPTGIPANWYPDPHGNGTLLRYWDGAQWTTHTAPVPPPAPQQ